MRINQKSELAFYERAFKHHKDRRERRYGSWEYTPSKSVAEIVRKNKLNVGSKDKRELDAGCGDGRHIQFFRSLGFSVVGVDFTANSIKVCQARFSRDKSVRLKRIDLTQRRALKALGMFDVANDWSVLDHIRGKYFKAYVKNISDAVRPGGFLILSEFDRSIPGLYKGRNYKIIKGHYFRAFSVDELLKIFKDFILVDKKERVLEDKINKYRFNTVLLKKPEK
ncbi:MAG: class I SAM-dependent methyltransferase [Candidatus Taylorbacteria bacterium]|nr:class I SAM-dependent methyltransferase [Candidatus Taylorbacteria bacterium]